MKKYENFCASLSNMKDIYEGLNYEEMQDILKCISTKNMSILVGNKKEEE